MPYEAKIAVVCQAFTVPPSAAEAEDEVLTMRVLEALTARQAMDAFNGTGKVSDAQGAVVEALLDELDHRDITQGVPEEE